jgi:hypothetical protein
MDYSLVLLGGNRQLSEPEIERAKQLCTRAAHYIDDRISYIERNGCDAKFGMPDANWRDDVCNDYCRVVDRLVGLDMDIVRLLRLRSQFFTGFSLLHMDVMENVVGISSLDDVPDNIDEVHTRLLARHVPGWTGFWKRMVENKPHREIFSPPRMMGEIGIDVNGVVVNADTILYQERVSLIYKCGLIDWLDKRLARNGRIKVMEIGSGYGALANWFKTAFPACEFTLLDLPESLTISSTYLGLTRPDLRSEFGLADVPAGLRFVPNYMAEQLTDDFDLVINTLSMSEMSEYQVATYARLLRDRWIANGGYFWEQNADNRHMGLIFAQEVLEKFLPHRYVVPGDGPLATVGRATLWSIKDSFSR